MKLIRINAYVMISHLILLGFQLYFWNFTIDDAFISFRYARNLYEHQQLVFNVNELPVEGYSNFLWVIWIWLGFLTGLEPIWFSKVSGLLFSHFSIIVLYKLGLRLGKSKTTSAIITIFYACLPNVALWSIGGLETALFTLLLMIAVYFFIYNLKGDCLRCGIASSFFFTLASLTRHEGVIIYAISILFLIGVQIKHRNLLTTNGFSKILSMLSCTILIYVPYFFWRVIYYDSLLPHTLLVKANPITLSFILSQLVFYLPLMLILLPSFVLIVLRVKTLKNLSNFISAQGYIMLIILTLGSILVLLSSWMPGYRFSIPLLPFFLLLIPDWLNFFHDLARKYQEDLNLLKYGKYLTVLVICFSHLSLFLSFNSYVQVYTIGINEINIKLGKWIDQNANQTASLAIWDVGAIPYYADIRTIDIYPESLQDKHIFYYPDDVNYILEQNITFLILNDEYFEYIKSDSRFIENYQLIFNAQLFYEENQLRIDYIYQIYLFNGYFISNASINSLIDSSPRFYI